MRKPIVTRIWLWGLAGLVVGLAAAGVATAVIFVYGGTYTYGAVTAREFTPNLDALFWSMVALGSVGALVALAGAVAQVVAWVGAMLATFAWADKTWFIVLLVSGLIGIFGVLIVPFAAMIAYIVAAPAEAARELHAGPSPPPASPTATAG